MIFRLDLRQGCFDFALGIDDESRALGAHVGLAIHAFLHPHPVGLDDRVLIIADDRERQLVLLDELFVALD